MGNSDFQRRLEGSQASFGRAPALLGRIHIDFFLLSLLVCLSAVGLFVLYSASGQDWGAVKRQASFFVIAWGGLLVTAQIPVKFYLRWAPLFYLTGLAALVAVIFVGVGAKGAQRWLDVPLLPRFQPSEIMKLALPGAVAWYIAKRSYPPSFKTISVSLLIVFIPVTLVLKQPDLGTSLLLAMAGLWVLFLGGIQWRYILGAITIVAASLYPAWHWLLHDYQRQRVMTLLNPESDKLGAGWNIIQSKTAIGSGGWDGKGWLQGTQSQLDFLPETHTDFIIAVIAEEFGLRGVVTLLALYSLIILRCLWVCAKADNGFGRLLAGGFTLTFFIYLAVNLGMVSGILPVVGVPLPMISQGGTSLVTLMIAFGFIMAVGTEEKQMNAQ